MTQITIDGNDTYLVSVIDDETAHNIYLQNKKFWFSRNFTSTVANQDPNAPFLLETYRNGYLKEEIKPLTDFLVKIIKARAEDGPVSILELGCANGPLLHFLKQQSELPDVRFVGFEPYGKFADDLALNFPEATVISGGGEEFQKTELAPYGPPFSLFFSSVTLCMIHPDIVRRCLQHAATVTDDIVIYDYCLNLSGNISADQTVIFQYNETTDQIYFAHAYESYLRQAGFEITDYTEIAVDGVQGYLVIHARKAAGQSGSVNEANQTINEIKRLFGAGEAAKAIDLCHALIDSGTAEGHYLLGVILSNVGKVDEALDHLAEAAQKLTERSDVTFNYGCVLQNAGHIDEAVVQWEATVNINPDHPEARFNLGRAYAEREDWAAAIAQYEQVCLLQPSNPEAHFNLGNANLRAGHRERAIVCYDRALNLEPSHSGAMQNRNIAVRDN